MLTGRIMEHGKGPDFPVFRGVSRQYGYGLDYTFNAAMRTVMSILKPKPRVLKYKESSK